MIHLFPLRLFCCVKTVSKIRHLSVDVCILYVLNIRVLFEDYHTDISILHKYPTVWYISTEHHLH